MEITPHAEGGFDILPQRIHFDTYAEANHFVRIETMQRQLEYIRDVKAANKQIWEGIAELAKLRREWDALALGDTLTDLDGVSAADVGAIVHATGAALETLLAQGHATNMARLLR
jgi:phosphoglycolate phosphatase-like HAD superfamily hydrolase